jgi:DNA replication initiation complex subunit (GINS family)
MSDRYERLHQAWRKEKASEDIQGIKDDLLREMRQYVIELNRMPLDTGTLTGRITQTEKQHVNQMFRELTDARLEKMVRRELEGKPIDAKALTPEEQRLHSNLRQLLASYRDGSDLPPVEQVRTPPAPRPSQEPPAPSVKAEGEGLVAVRFLQSLPAIMGVDMKAYGPFKPEDVASIPKQNAVNLIRRGIAKLVEIEP